MATAAPITAAFIGHLLSAEQKQAEADKYYKKEYGSMKPRINQPAKLDKKKLKNKRKQAKQSKKKNRG